MDLSTTPTCGPAGRGRSRRADTQHSGDLTSGPVILPVQRDTNSSKQWFGRGAVRWQPVQQVDLEVGYLHQNIDSDNSQIANPGFQGGPFDITTPVAGPISADNPPFYPNSTVNLNGGGTYASTAFTKAAYHDKIDLVSAVATVDLGFATVTSATSFYNDRSVAVSDYTPLFYSLATGLNFDAFHHTCSIRDSSRISR